MKKNNKELIQKDLHNIPSKAFHRIIHFNESRPFEILGPHLSADDRTIVINAYLPQAVSARIKIKGQRKKHEMKRMNEEGIFQITIEGFDELFSYKIIYVNEKNERHEIHDPYTFPLQLSDLDLHLLGEGNHYKSYDKLGAKITRIKKISGIHFAIWSPDAKTVSVTGEFNDWKPGIHPMQKIENTGYWGLFIPALKEGALYKFAVKYHSGKVFFKSDPYAFASELRPENASVAVSLKKHKWNDRQWMSERKKSSPANPPFKKEPVSIYEVHPGSWKKDYGNNFYSADKPNEWGYKNYRQLAHELVEYVKEMNYTHIELLPVMEHPLDISWGYQVVNYFAPTSRYGSPEDFMYFVDHCHQNGIGVILDWVPSHFPTDAHGLASPDGDQIYAYKNPKKGFHKDWGTFVFDYGRNEVRNFLISNALFWFEKYHIDGLRVDAVASMLYLNYSREDGEWEANIYGGNENLEAISFLKLLNETVHKNNKGIMMIAEESSSWQGVTKAVHLGGLGFDMKWNMGWMHDILAYFSMDPIFRKYHHGKLTFAIWYAFNENFLLPLSHDEVVHLKKSVFGKMPATQSAEFSPEWQKFANLRLLFGFMFSHPGKKLNFMGNDIAQYGEWNSESSLQWEVLSNDLNSKFHDYFRELNRIYKDFPAMHEVDFESRGFQWLDFSDSDNSVIGFVRYSSDKKEMLLFTLNMTPVKRENYMFGVPEKGFYREILNSNAVEFGGNGIGNLGGVHSDDIPRFEFQNSVRVTLPPLAVNVYKFMPDYSGKKELTDLKNEINLSDKDLKNSDEISVSEISELTDVTVPFNEGIEQETDLKESEEIVKPDSDIPENPELKAEENTKAGTEDKTSDQITAEIETADKPDSSEETDLKKTGEIKDLTEDEMEKKIKEIMNKIKKF